MIYLVNGADAERYPDWMVQMHQIRARVFKDRLNWDVEVSNGLERDSFDACNPLYVLSIDPAGRVQGSLRLLPTTGPNMLRDVFPVLLGPGECVESPTIWESSRFSIDPDAAPRDPNVRINRVTSELLCGIVEVGLMAGLSFILSVFDARMKRVLQSAGYPAKPIGTPQRIGHAIAYAGLFDVSDEAWSAIAAAGGIQDRVIARDSAAPARAA